MKCLLGWERVRRKVIRMGEQNGEKELVERLSKWERVGEQFIRMGKSRQKGYQNGRELVERKTKWIGYQNGKNKVQRLSEWERVFGDVSGVGKNN